MSVLPLSAPNIVEAELLEKRLNASLAIFRIRDKNPRSSIRTARMSATFTANNVFGRHYYDTAGTTAGGNYHGAPRNFIRALRATY